MSIECEHVISVLSELLDSKTKPEPAVELHLEQCESCRKFARDIAVLHRFSLAEPMLHPPPELKSSILKKACERGIIRNPVSVFHRMLSLELIATAAIVLLLYLTPGGTTFGQAPADYLPAAGIFAPDGSILDALSEILPIHPPTMPETLSVIDAPALSRIFESASFPTARRILRRLGETATASGEHVMYFLCILAFLAVYADFLVIAERMTTYANK